MNSVLPGPSYSPCPFATMVPLQVLDEVHTEGENLLPLSVTCPLSPVLWGQHRTQEQRVPCLVRQHRLLLAQPSRQTEAPGMPQVPADVPAKEPASSRCGQKLCFGSERWSLDLRSRGSAGAWWGQHCGSLYPEKGSRAASRRA